MRDLAQRTALVTGASHGLGTYIARALAAERMNVVLAARSAPELDRLAAELRQTGVEALSVPTNLADEGAPGRLIMAAQGRFGAVDVLVNNAGVFQPKPFHHHDSAELEHHVRVNLVAPLVLTALVLPGMLERGRGHIVNLGSLAGKAPPGFVEPYAATKAALIAFAASLRASYRRRGVSASAVTPGFVTEAGMYRTLQETTHVSAPRWLGTSTPDDVARAVVRAIKRDLPEVIVNPRPMRLVLAFRELFPRLAEWIRVETFEQAAARGSSSSHERG
jgi:short-subunit dehydrogenase